MVPNSSIRFVILTVWDLTVSNGRVHGDVQRTHLVPVVLEYRWPDDPLRAAVQASVQVVPAVAGECNAESTRHLQITQMIGTTRSRPVWSHKNILLFIFNDQTCYHDRNLFQFWSICSNRNAFICKCRYQSQFSSICSIRNGLICNCRYQSQFLSICPLEIILFVNVGITEYSCRSQILIIERQYILLLISIIYSYDHEQPWQ
jgi:hypothetical protein